MRASPSPFLTVSWILEVDVGVPEGPSGQLLAAYADGDHWSGLAELLVQRGLVHFGVKVTNVEGGYGEAGLTCCGVHLSVSLFFS